ncbi:MAG: 5-formyltetrahydrofolate cyclo-ligase [Desulfovibrio sp.]|jgi:5-formyltetrahydrofolate cyclo-ligase|nr:5-formyltetrahydrofolate cyclo-ligase [Desulfovibrio sp.]
MPDAELIGKKDSIRNALRKLRQTQPARLARVRGEAAQRRLMDAPCWREARSVALYAAFRGEIATDMLLEQAWQSGRTVFLPRVRPGEPGRMEFVPCAGREQLRPGAFGLPEPLPSLPGFGPEAAANKGFAPDVLIMPGVAFDRRGARLGSGGGYYDRFLGAGPACQRVGFCFSFQIVETLPVETWDQRVHALCTEEEFLCL